MYKAVTYDFSKDLACCRWQCFLLFKAAQAVFLWFRIFEPVGELRQSSAGSWELQRCRAGARNFDWARYLPDSFSTLERHRALPCLCIPYGIWGLRPDIFLSLLRIQKIRRNRAGQIAALVANKVHMVKSKFIASGLLPYLILLMKGISSALLPLR